MVPALCSSSSLLLALLFFCKEQAADLSRPAPWCPACILVGAMDRCLMVICVQSQNLHWRDATVDTGLRSQVQVLLGFDRGGAILA